MLINVNRELNSSMKKILSLSLLAAAHLSCINHKPAIYFILRNIMDLKISKQKKMIEGIKNDLLNISKYIKFDINKNLDF